MSRPKRIMYGKVGRAVIITPRRFGPVGGDHEPIFVLRKLAERHPDVEFVLASRYVFHDDEVEIPKNIVLPPMVKMETRYRYHNKVKSYHPEVNPWVAQMENIKPYFDDADEVAIWAGQMGTSNVPLPKINERSVYSEPQDSFMIYNGPISLNINTWRDVDPLVREETWIQSDVRNYLKCRDLKWPLLQSIVSQYDCVKKAKHERWGDERTPAQIGFESVASVVSGGGVWEAQHKYDYTGLEVIAVPAEWQCERDWNERTRFGLLINESRPNVALNRATVVKDWITDTDLRPDWIVGKWLDKGCEIAGIAHPEPIHHDQVADYTGSVRSTFMTPGSGSGWPTQKAWESFRMGTVCFMHPKYDDQGHIIPTRHQLETGAIRDGNLAHLTDWLRPRTPDELLARVEIVNTSPETYEWLRDAQFILEQNAQREERGMKLLESRLNLV